MVSREGDEPSTLLAVRASELEAARFGVFPRMRSLAGADVFPRGVPTKGARPIEQASLAEALTRAWDDDRHIVLYTSSQPFRVNNGAVDRVRVEVQLLAFDVDNHDDTPGWMDGERVKIEALLAAHPGGFVHTTRRGWRVLYALPSPFPVRADEDKKAFVLLYARVAAYVFERFGIALDAALIRWNQPVRLPHVVRDGRVFDAEVLHGDPHALGAFKLPETAPALPDLRALARVVPSWGGVAKQWQPARELLRVTSSATFEGIPLPPYAERVARAAAWVREHAPRAVMGHGGRATARTVASMLHVGFALERAEVEELLVGPYNSRRCSPPWQGVELEDLRLIAETVARTPHQPFGFLLTRDRTGLEAARATLAAAAAGRAEVPLAEVPARLREAVLAHRAVVLRATYGAGKTYAMSRYIAEETTTRVFVVVPRHELARAWVSALREAGETRVAHHASVVQRRDDEGLRICDNKVALRLYARGGDVRRDVCPSCPRAATCPAYAMRTDAQARVHVLPREMLAKFEVTAEDLVVFDDSAVDVLAWHRLTVRQLRRLAGADARMLPPVQRRYVTAFVEALLAGPRRAGELARLTLGRSFDGPEREALAALARHALHGTRAPRVGSDVLEEGGDELEATLRDAGLFRDVLRFAAACAEGAPIRWSDALRTIHGESAAAKLLRTHDGRLVVLDAAANVEELRALRSDLHVERLDVGDAGDASRLLLFAPNANRSALREPKARAAALRTWLEAALAHLTERCAKRPVLVAYKALLPELRVHPTLLAWLAENPRRRVRFAHYGAVRGSNRFQFTDAVVTLGDPWLNGDDVLGRAELLALVDEPAYRTALATAELGQAHGRSRSVRRRRRLTHVHVGRLVPDGWSAAGVEPLGGPPERSHDEADRLEFGARVGALGGNRAAARALCCSPAAVASWRTGSRSLPVGVLRKLRELSGSITSKASASSGEAPGGARGVTMDTGLCDQEIKLRVHGTELASRGRELSGQESESPGQELEEAPCELLKGAALSVSKNLLSLSMTSAPAHRRGDVPSQGAAREVDGEGRREGVSVVKARSDIRRLQPDLTAELASQVVEMLEAMGAPSLGGRSPCSEKPPKARPSYEFPSREAIAGVRYRGASNGGAVPLGQRSET